METKEGIEAEIDEKSLNELEDSERRRALRKRADEIERNFKNF